MSDIFLLYGLISLAGLALIGWVIWLGTQSGIKIKLMKAQLQMLEEIAIKHGVSLEKISEIKIPLEQ